MTLFDNAHTIYHLYPNITRYISEPFTDFLYRYDFSIKDITVSFKQNHAFRYLKVHISTKMLNK